MIKVHIVGPNGQIAQVDQDGQQRADAIADASQFLALNVVDTAFSFYPPIAGQQFCITLIHYRADRGVSTSQDAEVIVYQDDEVDGTTAAAADILHQDALVRGESATLPGILLLVDAGKFLNAKTSDNSVPMTIMGHYVLAR